MTTVKLEIDLEDAEKLAQDATDPAVSAYITLCKEQAIIRAGENLTPPPPPYLSSCEGSL